MTSATSLPRGCAPPTAPDLPPGKAILAVLMLMAAQAGVLHAFGMPPICKCGTVKLWHGVVMSAENSQHLTDWYTFTHVTHGLIFYGLVWLALPRAALLLRFVLATAVEVGWEIVENTPFIIERYRAGTFALDYYGDSIVNSLSDTAAMVIGFLIAWRAPVWASLVLAVGSEIALGILVRDNLTLNVLMLLYPIEAVLKWQSGA